MTDFLPKEELGRLYDAFLGLPLWQQVVLVLVVVVITQGQKLLALRARWYDYRLGRNRLQFEKELLENLKLHYEIEAIKKEHNLPTDEFEKELFRERQASSDNITGLRLPKRLPNLMDWVDAHITKKQLWGWAISNPTAGRIVISLLSFFSTLYAYFFAFAALVMPLAFVLIDDPLFREDRWTIAISTVVYLLLALVLFYWKKVFAHYRAGLEKRLEENNSKVPDKCQPGE